MPSKTLLMIGSTTLLNRLDCRGTAMLAPDYSEVMTLPNPNWCFAICTYMFGKASFGALTGDPCGLLHRRSCPCEPVATSDAEARQADNPPAPVLPAGAVAEMSVELKFACLPAKEYRFE